MKLRNFQAKNFKGLHSVEVVFEDGVNLIVGPNAIGKTTVLDAIRLVKGVLAPRTQTETFQTLLSLGAATHFNRNSIILDAIAGDLNEPVVIKCGFDLTEHDTDFLKDSITDLAEESLKRQMNFGGDISSWLAFKSNFHGMMLLERETTQITSQIQNIRDGKRQILLGLECNPRTGVIKPIDAIAPALFSYLEGKQSHRQTRFSYFPADRALPRGEQPVQLGTQDAQQTLESHSAQAELKYSRIKNHIFNALIEGGNSKAIITQEFEAIFSAVLKGKKLASEAFCVNLHGQLSIMVTDVSASKSFDIDQMSSGEKSLILTYLMIGRSITNGGIVLLDEPELHLNPAVCRDALDFLVEHYVIPKKLQVIACTHSPEIVAAAFARPDCHIYHLESGNLLAKARRQDDDEISEALRRLGTSEAESLLYPSTVFVEGESDIELLKAGFSDILRRQNVKSLGGRNEVEKDIRTFQRKEGLGGTFPVKYFLFDLDHMPTKLKSSSSVRLRQIARKNIENYLLDLEVLTDILKEGGATKLPVLGSGRLEAIVREIAMSQMHEQCIRDVYSKEVFDGLGLRTADVEGKTLAQTTEIVVDRIRAAQTQLADFNPSTWSGDFVIRVASREKEMEPIWNESWMKLCDGKRLFTRLKEKLGIAMPLDKLKLRIVREMRARRAPLWLELRGLIEELLTP